MNARLRRLAADYAQILTEFAGHPYITVEPLGGNPPDRYKVTYRLKGLRWDDELDRPMIQPRHAAEIYLHIDYPRQKPQCTMLTEIWHPNMGNFICIGDFWAAGETLADVIVQIGDMIQYKTYNPKSPINGAAAQWARRHADRLPVANIDLYQAEPEITLAQAEEQPSDTPEIVDITINS